jgi:hypothetical protein
MPRDVLVVTASSLRGLLACVRNHFISASSLNYLHVPTEEDNDLDSMLKSTLRDMP